MLSYENRIERSSCGLLSKTIAYGTEHPPMGTVIEEGKDIAIGLFVTVIEYFTRDVYRADIPDYDLTIS